MRGRTKSEVCNEAGYEGKDKSVKPTQKVGFLFSL